MRARTPDAVADPRPSRLHAGEERRLLLGRLRWYADDVVSARGREAPFWCWVATSSWLVLALPFVAAAQGAFPDPPRIVHTLSPIGGHETWLVETRLGADEPRRLFAVSHRVAGGPIPALSADGRWLAYTAVSPSEPATDLVLVDLLGGASRTLARGVAHARPVFDRFGIELYAVRVERRVPSRPTRADGPPGFRPSSFELVAIGVSSGNERRLLRSEGTQLFVVGVSQHGEILVYREQSGGSAIVALDPRDGRSRVVSSLGARVARDLSISSTDDRLLFARSTDRAQRRWEIVLCELGGRSRVLRRERYSPLAPVRVGDTVMYSDVQGSPLRAIDLNGRDLPRTQSRGTQTRHRVIASTPDGRITVMRRDTPEGTGFVALDREASYALPLTTGGVLVDVAGFR